MQDSVKTLNGKCALPSYYITHNPTHMFWEKHKAFLNFSLRSYKSLHNSRSHKNTNMSSKENFTISHCCWGCLVVNAFGVEPAPLPWTSWYMPPPAGLPLASHPALPLAQRVSSVNPQQLIHTPVLISLKEVDFAIGPGEGCIRTGRHSSEEHRERFGVAA